MYPPVRASNGRACGPKGPACAPPWPIGPSRARPSPTGDSARQCLCRQPIQTTHTAHGPLSGACIIPTRCAPSDLALILCRKNRHTRPARGRMGPHCPLLRKPSSERHSHPFERTSPSIARTTLHHLPHMPEVDAFDAELRGGQSLRLRPPIMCMI